MNILKLLVVFVGLLWVATACRDEFNDHYDAKSLAGLNVVQVLGEYEDLSLFAQLVEKAGLSQTLGESGIYTVLAPRNENVQQWLDEEGYTVDNVPDDVLIPWVNYHFVTGRYYVYDLELSYDGLLDLDFDMYPYYYLQYYSGGYLLRYTRGDRNYDSKPIRLFSSSYFDVFRSDYVTMYGTEPGDFMVEGASVSATDRDIAASNGVVHILDGYLPLTPRCDEAIFAQGDCSIVQGWLNLFRRTEVRGAEDGTIGSTIDTTSVTVFSLTEAGNGYVCDIADEDFVATVLLPTDAAVEAYLGQYMTADQFGTSYDSIPRALLANVLQSLILDGYSTLGPTLLSQDYTADSYNGTILSLRNNIPALFSGMVLSSNAMIYKLNEFPVLPIFTCAEAGLYIKQNHYSVVNDLMEAVGVSGLGLSSSTYQNYDCTLLLPPDDAWDRALEDYDGNYLDSLYNDVLSVGSILANVQDGEFEHRYYQTSSGTSLLYENGTFTDAWGNEFTLRSATPTFSAESGAIYDVNGFGEMMYTTDTTVTVMKRILEIPELSTFAELCTLGEVYGELNQVNVNDYTVFAPTNDALAANGISVSSTSAAEAENIVRRHLILNRKIFTDGQTTGTYSSSGNLNLTFSGAWDSFRISTQYGGAQVAGESNVQGSNGVVHCIDNVLEN